MGQASFQYDSTLSYADRPGFRCGTCHPDSMFDPLAQLPLRLIQRPLIAMECSVIAPRYLGLGYGDESLALFDNLKQRCQAVGGQFTLLWHNTHFTTAADWNLYHQVLLSGNKVSFLRGIGENYLSVNFNGMHRF